MTIAVKESYLNTLRVFGDVNQLIDQAVEDFLTRRIIERIRAAREKIGAFEKEYGMPYATFSERVQLDEAFYQQVNQANPLWEQDALAWEYWHEEAQEWSEKLNAILSKS